VPARLVIHLVNCFLYFSITHFIASLAAWNCGNTFQVRSRGLFLVGGVGMGVATFNGITEKFLWIIFCLRVWRLCWHNRFLVWHRVVTLTFSVSLLYELQQRSCMYSIYTHIYIYTHTLTHTYICWCLYIPGMVMHSLFLVTARWVCVYHQPSGHVVFIRVNLVVEQVTV
jgi:hypothetical protein